MPVSSAWGGREGDSPTPPASDWPEPLRLWARKALRAYGPVPFAGRPAPMSRDRSMPAGRSR
jgi:hypothetical protein